MGGEKLLMPWFSLILVCMWVSLGSIGSEKRKLIYLSVSFEKLSLYKLFMYDENNYCLSVSFEYSCNLIDVIHMLWTNCYMHMHISIFVFQCD